MAGKDGYEKINTVKLAADAIAGHGCSILDAFDGMSLQSQLVAIADMNLKFHNDKSSKLFAKQDGEAPISLVVKEVGLFKPELFHETFETYNRKIEFNCTDKTPNGFVSRTVRRSF